MFMNLIITYIKRNISQLERVTMSHIQDMIYIFSLFVVWFGLFTDVTSDSCNKWIWNEIVRKLGSIFVR